MAMRCTAASFNSRLNRRPESSFLISPPLRRTVTLFVSQFRGALHYVLGTFCHPCVRVGQAKYWSEWQDLNLRPPRPERGALPDCATLRLVGGFITTPKQGCKR